MIGVYHELLVHEVRSQNIQRHSTARHSRSVWKKSLENLFLLNLFVVILCPKRRETMKPPFYAIHFGTFSLCYLCFIILSFFLLFFVFIAGFFLVLCHSISHTLHVQLFTHHQRGRRKESRGGSTEGGPDGITNNLTRLTWTEEVEFS